MPIVDRDRITIHQATRAGRIAVVFSYTTAAAQSLGRMGVSFRTVAEVRSFLEQGSLDDVLRAALLQCVDPADGSLRAAVFDALPGKTFEVRIGVAQV